MTDAASEHEPKSSDVWLSELFGPDITHEEELCLLDSSDQLKRLFISQTLALCMSKDSVEAVFGIPHEEITRRIQDKELIAIQVDDEAWLPSWQFRQTEDREYDMQPMVSLAWEAWGRGDDTLTFCNMMRQHDKSYGRARVDILLGDDPDAIADVMASFAQRGIRYM